MRGLDSISGRGTLLDVIVNIAHGCGVKRCESSTEYRAPNIQLM